MSDFTAYDLDTSSLANPVKLTSSGAIHMPIITKIKVSTVETVIILSAKYFAFCSSPTAL